MTAATSVAVLLKVSGSQDIRSEWHTGLFTFVVWTVFLRMRFLGTFALDMRRSRLAEASAVVTLRNRAAFFVDVNQRAI